MPSSSSASASYDVVVVGGGVMGCSTAYAVAKSGKSVALCEQFEIGHEKGSSHGLRRIFRCAYPDRDHVEMVRLSLKLWDEVAERTKTRVYQHCGILMTGEPENEYFASVRKNYEDFGLPHDVMTKDECEERFPRFRLLDKELGIFQKDAGVMYASKCVESLKAGALSLGADLIEGSRVVGISRRAPGGLSTSSSPRYLVALSTGKVISCKKVVLTAGPWTNKLLESMKLRQLPLRVTLEQVLYLYPSAQDKHLYHIDSGLPVYLACSSEIGHYALPLTGDGKKGLKQGFHLRGEEVADPDKLTDEDRQSRMKGLERECKEFAKVRMPELAASTDELGSARCLYTTTPDSKMVIGPHPDDEGVIVGAGFSGEGFKFASLVGELLSEFADGSREMTYDVPSVFSPTRFLPTDGSQKATYDVAPAFSPSVPTKSSL